MDNTSIDYKMKKYEIMYSTTLEALIQQESRYDELERKIYRYLTVLVIFFVGLTGIGVSGIVKAAKNIEGVIECAFILSYLFLVATAVLAFVGIIRALRLEKLKSLPMNEAMIRHFERNRYIDILNSISISNIKAIMINNKTIRAKVKSAKFGYRFMLIVIIFSLVTGILYILISIQSA